MDETLKTILDSLPEKKPRSRLEPYAALIDALRRQGRTYRDIARILEEKCQMRASRSTVNDFMRSRTKRRRRKLQSPAFVNPPGINRKKMRAEGLTVNLGAQNRCADDEVLQRITALKQRPCLPEESHKPFEYDPNAPLRLPPSPAKNEDSE